MAATSGWRIERVPLVHPDAARLTREVELEYAARYGAYEDSYLDAREFDPPRGSFFVGYLGAEAVATGAWRVRGPLPDVAGEVLAEIKRMYVVSSARGRGLGRRVLAHLEDTAAAAGVEALVLETGTGQPEAIGLYTTAAYTPITGFGYYRDGPLSRCFGKSLAP